jgi:HAD superfamily hydrolase (TIGR01490 family)
MVKVQTKKLILFDFDGTITTRDTLVEFLMFYKGPIRFVLGMLFLAPVILLYVFKIIPNWKGKQVVLRYFLGGENKDIFNTRCLEFAQKHLPRLIRSGALDAIQKYKEDGATIAVVTASAENWVAPWCNTQDIICIGTQLEVVNGRISGNLCGPNCYGPEKVKRIEKQFMLKDFDHIVAYGDSSGDKEMFSIAHRYHYKPFRSQAT